MYAITVLHGTVDVCIFATREEFRVEARALLLLPYACVICCIMVIPLLIPSLLGKTNALKHPVPAFQVIISYLMLSSATRIHVLWTSQSYPVLSRSYFSGEGKAGDRKACVTIPVLFPSGMTKQHVKFMGSGCWNPVV